MEAGPPRYEFDAGQNELIAVLAERMKWVAWFMIGLSIILMIGALVSPSEGTAGLIIQATLTFIVAVWTRRAAAAFDGIVKTEGSDIANLMDALGQLKKLYTLQYWVMLLAIALVTLAIILGLGVLAFGGG